MTLKVFAGISLRNEEGVHFGTLVRIRTGLAGVQTDAVYRVGDRLEFQLDLTGFDTTVHGIAEVRRADTRQDDLSSYLLRVIKMRRVDQDLLQEWYEQQQAGLEPSLLDNDDHRALDSQVESQISSAMGADLPAPPVPEATHGRAAIRALLLEAAHGVDTAGITGGAAAEEPDLLLDLDTVPPVLRLRYRTAGSWRRDRDAQLGRGLLFVPTGAEALQLETSLMVVFERPGQTELSCSARVALLHERGVGLSLDLDPSTLHEP